MPLEPHQPQLRSILSEARNQFFYITCGCVKVPGIEGSKVTQNYNIELILARSAPGL